MATALLDRLLHRWHVINIKGRSYRLRGLERLSA
jgi:DNA replication protein DnaC